MAACAPRPQHRVPLTPLELRERLAHLKQDRPHQQLCLSSVFTDCATFTMTTAPTQPTDVAPAQIDSGSDDHSDTFTLRFSSFKRRVAKDDSASSSSSSSDSLTSAATASSSPGLVLFYYSFAQLLADYHDTSDDERPLTPFSQLVASESDIKLPQETGEIKEEETLPFKEKRAPLRPRHFLFTRDHIDLSDKRDRAKQLRDAREKAREKEDKAREKEDEARRLETLIVRAQEYRRRSCVACMGFSGARHNCGEVTLCRTQEQRQRTCLGCMGFFGVGHSCTLAIRF